MLAFICIYFTNPRIQYSYKNIRMLYYLFLNPYFFKLVLNSITEHYNNIETGEYVRKELASSRPHTFTVCVRKRVTTGRATLLCDSCVLPRMWLKCNNMQYYKYRSASIGGLCPAKLPRLRIFRVIASAPRHIQMYITLTNSNTHTQCPHWNMFLKEIWTFDFESMNWKYELWKYEEHKSRQTWGPL